MDTNAVNLAFLKLADALRGVLLPTSTTPRFVAPGEFALMDVRHGRYRFKHHLTRNYLLLHTKTGKVTIPLGGPFCRGEFDGE